MRCGTFLGGDLTSRKTGSMLYQKKGYIWYHLLTKTLRSASSKVSALRDASMQISSAAARPRKAEGGTPIRSVRTRATQRDYGGTRTADARARNQTAAGDSGMVHVQTVMMTRE